MFEALKIIRIEKDLLLEKVRQMRDDGYRLVQIGCTPLEEFQLDYSFDRAGKFIDLRFSIPREGEQIPSITDIYLCAFTYENEIHDLFGIEVTGIAIDYDGQFYRIKSKPPLTPLMPDKGKEKTRNDQELRKKSNRSGKESKDNRNHNPIINS